MLVICFFRFLLWFLGKILSVCNRENGVRCLLLFGFIFFILIGCWIYVVVVELVGSKVVLVIGCDFGFGFLLVKYLYLKGFFVFVGCLMKDKGYDGVKELDSLNSD